MTKKTTHDSKSLLKKKLKKNLIQVGSKTPLNRYITILLYN